MYNLIIPKILNIRYSILSFKTTYVKIKHAISNFFSYKRHDFKVGVSIDGPKDYHDRYRVYPHGNGSFTRVMRGISHLREVGIMPKILAVVTQESATAPQEIFNFFVREQLSKEISFNPASGIEAGSGISFLQSVPPRQYIDFLIAVFDLWMLCEDPELKVYPLESIVRGMLGFPQMDCRFAEKTECEKSIVIDVDGTVTACSAHGYQFGEYTRFGNIRDGVELSFDSSSPQRQGYRQFLQQLHQRCAGCEWYEVCQGGCPRDHWLGPTSNIYCAELKRLYAHIHTFLKQMGVL